MALKSILIGIYIGIGLICLQYDGILQIIDEHTGISSKLHPDNLLSLFNFQEVTNTPCQVETVETGDNENQALKEHNSQETPQDDGAQEKANSPSNDNQLPETKEEEPKAQENPPSTHDPSSKPKEDENNNDQNSSSTRDLSSEPNLKEQNKEENPPSQHGQASESIVEEPHHPENQDPKPAAENQGDQAKENPAVHSEEYKEFTENPLADSEKEHPSEPQNTQDVPSNSQESPVIAQNDNNAQNAETLQGTEANDLSGKQNNDHHVEANAQQAEHHGDSKSQIVTLIKKGENNESDIQFEVDLSTILSFKQTDKKITVSLGKNTPLKGALEGNLKIGEKTVALKASKILNIEIEENEVLQWQVGPQENLSEFSRPVKLKDVLEKSEI